MRVMQGNDGRVRGDDVEGAGGLALGLACVLRRVDQAFMADEEIALDTSGLG
jgi:hypothetical protein